MRRRISLVAVMLALAAPAKAEPPRAKKLDASSALGALTGNQTTAALSGNLRALLVEDQMVQLLFDPEDGWVAATSPVPCVDAASWNIDARFLVEI